MSSGCPHGWYHLPRGPADICHQICTGSGVPAQALFSAFQRGPVGSSSPAPSAAWWTEGRDGRWSVCREGLIRGGTAPHSYPYCPAWCLGVWAGFKGRLGKCRALGIASSTASGCTWEQKRLGGGEERQPMRGEGKGWRVGEWVAVSVNPRG